MLPVVGEGSDGGDPGQANPNTRSYADLALYLDSATMRFGDLLHDGEAQTEPARGTRAALVGAKERKKDVAQVIGRDADALVAHLDPYAAPIHAGRDFNRGARVARVLVRILEKVLESAAQEDGITFHDRSISHRRDR